MKKEEIKKIEVEKKGQSVYYTGILKDLKDGSKQGSKEGSKSEEQMSGEQYEIYKQQSELREELNSLLKKGSKEGNKSNEAVKQMEELENMLLKNGFTDEVIEKGEKTTCSFFLDNDLITLDGKIMRVSEKENKLFKYGIQFININLSTQKKLEELIIKG